MSDETATNPSLLAAMKAARLHGMSPAEIEAQRRSWVIGELMLDDPALSRAEAEALYDQATRETASSPRARFAADLLKQGVRLPLTVSADCQASLVDADGRDVLTVDIHRQRPDAEACKIALWIALAVNTCGGFTLRTMNGGGK